LVEVYNEALEEAKAGNFSGFGESVEKLGDVISKLNQTAGLIKYHFIINFYLYNKYII